MDLVVTGYLERHNYLYRLLDTIDPTIGDQYTPSDREYIDYNDPLTKNLTQIKNDCN